MSVGRLGRSQRPAAGREELSLARGRERKECRVSKKLWTSHPLRLGAQRFRNCPGGLNNRASQHGRVARSPSVHQNLHDDEGHWRRLWLQVRENPASRASRYSKEIYQLSCCKPREGGFAPAAAPGTIRNTGFSISLLSLAGSLCGPMTAASDNRGYTFLCECPAGKCNRGLLSQPWTKVLFFGLNRTTWVMFPINNSLSGNAMCWLA